MSDTTVFAELSQTSSIPSSPIRPLSQRSIGYLQVVVSEFSLTREGRGLRLGVSIPDDPLTLIDGRGKRDLEAAARARPVSGKHELQRSLDEFHSNSNLLGYRFDCSNWPMRFANGGVLPVIQLEGDDYFLMFYRDIFPIGWNIANGASDNTDEWLDPGRIILREFGEEVLIFDPTASRFHIYEPPGSARPLGFHEEALAAWIAIRPELSDFERAPIPLKWIEGPDAVDVQFGGRRQPTKQVFLNVLPEDQGIEVDRIALIRLHEDARFLCGEIFNNQLCNQMVGLFHVERVRELFDGNAFHPDYIDFDGNRYPREELEKLRDTSLDGLRSRGLRRDDQVAFYDQASVKFNFCPITRSMIKRYYEWERSGEKAPSSTIALKRPTEQPGGANEIFISHRSTHVDHARALHDFLKSKGHSVFFSDESLAAKGESDYERAISHALDQARCLILLALDPKDLQSGWVDFEWKAFHCELLSQRKQGDLFTLLQNVSMSDLPLALRTRQSIPYSLASPQDSFENLYRYLGPALNKFGQQQAQ